MRLYVINMNPQPNTRDNEVHVRDCATLNFANNLRDLGFHNSCHTAGAQAKQMGSPMPTVATTFASPVI